MTNTNARNVVDHFNKALEAKDFAAARKLLADDLSFEGPIDRFSRADDYMTAISRLHGMVKGVEHEGLIVEGDEVALFYVLDTPIAKAPVAERYIVRDGKITKLRAYFDARPFAAAAPRQ